MTETRTPDSSREILAKRHRKSSPFVQIHRYTCLKTGERLSGESHIERDSWLYFDTKPNIRALRTELDSVLVGRRRYTPDWAALTDDNRIVYYEGKSDQVAQDPRFLEKFAEKVAFYDAHGLSLRLFAKSDLPDHQHMRNLKLFYVYATGHPPSQGEQEALKGLLEPSETSTFGELSERLAASQMTTHSIWYGLARGEYAVEMNQPIDHYSIITRRSIPCS